MKITYAKQPLAQRNDNHFAILRINIPHVTLFPLKKLIFQMQTIAYPHYLPILKIRHWKTINILNEVKVLWRLVAVGNGSKIPLFVFFNTFNTSPRWLVDFQQNLHLSAFLSSKTFFNTLDLWGGISVYFCQNFERSYIKMYTFLGWCFELNRCCYYSQGAAKIVWQNTVLDIYN